MTGYQKAIVASHLNVTLYLLERVEHNTDQNQKRCATKELCKALTNAKHACKGGQDGNQRDEQRTGQQDTRHYGVEIIGRRFAGFNTGNETVVALHIFGHLNGIERDCRVEIGECDDKHNQNYIVGNTGVVTEAEPETTHIGAGRHNGERNEHNGLSKNDRHYVGGKELQGDVLTCTAQLATTFNAFGILHGHLAGGLDEKDGQCHNKEQGDNLEKELHKSTTLAGREH